MVHADGTAPAVLLDKRTVDERLRRTLGQAPIAASHLDASKAQLARHTQRHEVAGSVDNEVPVVGHTLSDGDILHPSACRDAVVRGVVGALRRPVDIDNLYMVAVDAVHLLAATRGKADGQVVEGVEQQTGHCRRITASRTLMVYEELADGCEIFTNLRRHDVERAAQRQHGVHILDVRVERERAVAADAVVGRQLLHVDDDSDEVA